MAMLEKSKKKKLDAIEQTLAHPFVSIIVPAYNEEVNAVSSLENLLKCDYPDFEIIFIDDGSKDNTYDIVRKAFENNPLVKVFTKKMEAKLLHFNMALHNLMQIM